MTYPKYSVRRVRIVREEFQVLENMGNRLNYVDPEKGNGKINYKQASQEVVEVIEAPRLLTEIEAGLMGLPFEGERITSTEPSDG